MQNITSTAELKNAIQLLEVEQVTNEQLLKEQFYLTYESFRPVNLLKNGLKNIALSPYLIDTIFGTTLGLAVNYLVKNKGLGTPVNMVRKLIGSVLRFGATNVLAHNSDAIRSFGQLIFQHIFRKKEMNSNSRER